jgi:hypothetical protein
MPNTFHHDLRSSEAPGADCTQTNPKNSLIFRGGKTGQKLANRKACISLFKFSSNSSGHYDISVENRYEGFLDNMQLLVSVDISSMSLEFLD